MKKLTFIILCAEGAVLSFNVAAAATLVPSIAQDFVLSQFLVGKIIWLYMLPYGLAALIYGPLVRFFSAKKIELVCMLLFSLANLLAAGSKNIQMLFAARFFMGFFGASVIPLALILIAHHIESKQRGKFVGIFFSATFVASLLGLFLSSILHWRLIFLLPGLAGMALLVAMYFYLPNFDEHRTNERVNYLAVFNDRRIFFIFSYIFCISLIYHVVQQWLAVYFSIDLNFSQFVISILVTLTSLSGVFGEVLGGKLVDSAGRLRTVNLGIILMIFSVFLLILKAPVFIYALLMVIWGVGWTFNHVAVSTIITDLPKRFLNESASLNSSIRFISGGLGAAIGGYLMQKSFSLGFLTAGVSLVILAIFTRSLIQRE